jgi:hypothetical protein
MKLCKTCGHSEDWHYYDCCEECNAGERRCDVADCECKNFVEG